MSLTSWFLIGIMIFISFLLLGLVPCAVSCGRLWYACEFVLEPYVMRVLLFMLRVCMMRECEDYDNSGVGMD